MGVLTKLLVAVILLLLAIAVVSMSIQAAAPFLAVLVVCIMLGIVYDLVNKEDNK